VDDNNAAVENTSRPKADPGDSSQVGAPMSGVVVEIRVKDGGEVKKGDPIAVLSAMKMVSIHAYRCQTPTNNLLGNGYLRTSRW
jgi:pyruvate carboxylase